MIISTETAAAAPHPQLARPLFHVWNLIQTDLDLGRWNMPEHRWGNVANMVAFRNYTGKHQEDWTVTHWWDNGNNRIAFGRNGEGFVVINKEDGTLNEKLSTGLPAGSYCDIMKGRLSLY